MANPNMSVHAAHDRFTEHLEATEAAGQLVKEALAEAQQKESEARIMSAAEDTDISLYKQITKSEKFKEKEATKAEKVKSRSGEESVLVRKGATDDMAGDFAKNQDQRAYHLYQHIRGLQKLAKQIGGAIHEKMGLDEMRDHIHRTLKEEHPRGIEPDVSVVDKAFEFLMHTTNKLKEDNTKLTEPFDKAKERLVEIHERISEAKIKHFAENQKDIELFFSPTYIGAVDAMVEASGEFVDNTLKTARDFVHNPEDLQTVFKNYDKIDKERGEWQGFDLMVKESKGLNTYLTSNFKRTDMENAEVAALASAAKKRGALIHVYKDCKEKGVTAENFLEINGVLERKAKSA